MKFYGSIGFWLGDSESEDAVYEPRILERPGYRGEIRRYTIRNQPVSNQQNDDLTINNQISIISDLYLQQNWSSVRYVVWNGVRWKVTSIEVGYPRIVLDIGGVYNGPTVDSSERSIKGEDRDSKPVLQPTI